MLTQKQNNRFFDKKRILQDIMVKQFLYNLENIDFDDPKIIKDLALVNYKIQTKLIESLLTNKETKTTK